MEVKVDGKIIAGLCVDPVTVQHVRVGCDGNRKTTYPVYIDGNDNQCNIVTGACVVVQNEEECMGHRHRTVAYQNFKKGDVIAASSGELSLVGDLPDDQIFVRKFLGQNLVLKPTVIGTNYDLAKTYSVSEGGCKGHHLVAQYCMATSNEEESNAEKVAFGPYHRGKNDEFRVMTGLVSPNMGCTVASRMDYDCGFFVKATKNIEVGDLILYYDARAAPLLKVAYDMSGYGIGELDIKDGQTFIAKAKILVKEADNKDQLIVDSGASDPEDRAEIEPRAVNIYRQESQWGDEYSDVEDDDECIQESGQYPAVCMDREKKIADQKKGFLSNLLGAAARVVGVGSKAAATKPSDVIVSIDVSDDESGGSTETRVKNRVRKVVSDDEDQERPVVKRPKLTRDEKQAKMVATQEAVLKELDAEAARRAQSKADLSAIKDKFLAQKEAETAKAVAARAAAQKAAEEEAAKVAAKAARAAAQKAAEEEAAKVAAKAAKAAAKKAADEEAAKVAAKAARAAAKKAAEEEADKKAAEEEAAAKKADAKKKAAPKLKKTNDSPFEMTKSKRADSDDDDAPIVKPRGRPPGKKGP